MRKALILSALAAMLLGIAGEAIAQPQLETPEEFLRYLSIHRKEAALVTYTAAADGTPDPADPVLFHNADEPMPLASVIKIVVLAAYAREVVAGRLDPQEEITLADWERYYLPWTDGGAHVNALTALGIPTDENGFALDPGTIVSLDTLTRAMVRRSDNAATDFLLERLGRATLQETIDEAGLAGQELPLPLLGLFLSWDNHEEGELTLTRLQQLLGFSETRYTARIDRLAARYLNNEAWRQAQILWLSEGRFPIRYPLQVQVAVARFPAGTARDYARIMAGVVSGTFLSPEISAVMRPHLERDLLGTTDFESIGFKGGTLAGVHTAAAWYVPREGDFAGKPRIVVLFQRRVPLVPWALIRRDAHHVVFAFRLAQDRAFALRTQKMLTPRE